MQDPNDQLLAQADTGDRTSDPKTGTTNDGATVGADGKDDSKAGESVFTQLLSNLGDHRELHFGKAHVPLPVMFFDNGFHFYPSLHSMEDNGGYRYDEAVTHRIVN